jgi:hypothetical protein
MADGAAKRSIDAAVANAMREVRIDVFTVRAS